MANFIVKVEKFDGDGKMLGFIPEIEKNFGNVEEAIAYRNEVLETKDSLKLDDKVKKLTGHVCLQTNLDAEMFGYPVLPHTDIIRVL